MSGDGMGWVGMGWDRMSGDGMGWDKMSGDGVGWDGMGWVVLTCAFVCLATCYVFLLCWS